jgi:thioredoxin 1
MNNSHSLTEVSESWFDQHVLGSDGPLLVVFWTDGCDTCERLLALLRNSVIRDQRSPTVVLINRKQSPALAARLGVISVPALLLFDRGNLCYQFVGEISRSELADLLARASLTNTRGEKQGQRPASPCNHYPASGGREQ